MSPPLPGCGSPDAPNGSSHLNNPRISFSVFAELERRKEAWGPPRAEATTLWTHVPCTGVCISKFLSSPEPTGPSGQCVGASSKPTTSSGSREKPAWPRPTLREFGRTATWVVGSWAGGPGRGSTGLAGRVGYPACLCGALSAPGQEKRVTSCYVGGASESCACVLVVGVPPPVFTGTPGVGWGPRPGSPCPQQGPGP